MILQKNGEATPSVTASLIERLSDEGDPQRSREERIAKRCGFCNLHRYVVHIANLATPVSWPLSNDFVTATCTLPVVVVQC